MNMEHLRLVLELCRAGKEVIEEIWKLEENVQIKIFGFMWQRWSAQNKVNEGDKMISGAENVVMLHFVSELANLNLQGKENKQLQEQAWKPPLDDLYKINIDAPSNPETKKGGWGFIVRKSW